MFPKALLGQTADETEEFTDLDDISMLHCFKLWTAGDDVPLAALCRGLLFRRCFKTIDLTHVENAQSLAEKIADAIKNAGGTPEYQMFFDAPENLPYEMDAADPSPEILVCDPAGKLTALSKLSPMPAAMNQQVQFQRVHVAEQWRDLAKQTIAEAG